MTAAPRTAGRAAPCFRSILVRALTGLALVLAHPVALPQTEPPAAAAATVPTPGKDAVTPPAKPDTGLPALVASGFHGDFGQQGIGAGGSVQAVILKNGEHDLTLTDIHANGPFTVTPGKCKLAARGSCALDVSFVPTHVGNAIGALTVSNADGTSVVMTLTGNATPRCSDDHWYVCSTGDDLGPVAVLVVAYWILLIAVRWNVIAIPSRSLLLAEIAAVRSRFPQLLQAPVPGDYAPIAGLLERAEAANVIDGLHPLHLNILFWSRGTESVGWSLVHEAEEQLLPLQSQEQIRVGLESAESFLRTSNASGAPELADQIHLALNRTVTVLDDPYRSVLAETAEMLRQLTPLQAVVTAQLTVPAPVPLSPADLSAFTDQFVRACDSHVKLLTARAGALAAIANPTAPEFDVLVAHVSGVLLPEAAVQLQAFQSAAAAGAVPPGSFAAAADFLRLADATALRIQAALDVAPRVPLERWRALLAEASGVIYDRRDTDFAGLISWHNKTIWLIEIGLLLILALAATLGHSIFFLLGATGGLLSRLSRTLYRADVVTDYGASWTTLFLSPVIGAMAAWSGMLLASLAVDLGVLGQLFQAVKWDNPYAVLAMALAFMLGFSERLFDTILTQLQDKVLVKAPASATVTGLTIDTGTALGDAVVGADYAGKLITSGGKSPYTYRTTAGSLPVGLAIGATSGSITGKPTTAGDSRFTVEVKDATGTTSTKEFTLAVKAKAGP